MARGETVPDQFLGRIESVRGLAALAVLIGHTSGMIVPMDRVTSMLRLSDSHTFWARLLASPVIGGETAVLLFFVISGFVIGRSLDRSSEPGFRTYTIFLIRRALRLYPAHILAILVIVALVGTLVVGAPRIELPAVDRGSSWLNEALNGDYVQSLDWRRLAGNLGLFGWTLNFPAWSLYVELCAAPMLPLFHAFSRRQGPIAEAVLLVVMMGVALTGADLWCRYWFAFYLGIMVQTHGRAVAGWTSRRAGGIGPALLIVYVLLIVPTQLATDRPQWVIVAEALAAFLLVSLVAWGGQSKALGVLDRHPLRWNGKVSYSFYLYHYTLMVLVARGLYLGLGAATVERHAWLFCIAAIVAVSATAWTVAYLSYRFVELPGIAFGHRIANRLRARRPAFAGAGPIVAPTGVEVRAA